MSPHGSRSSGASGSDSHNKAGPSPGGSAHASQQLNAAGGTSSSQGHSSLTRAAMHGVAHPQHSSATQNVLTAAHSGRHAPPQRPGMPASAALGPNIMGSASGHSSAYSSLPHVGRAGPYTGMSSAPSHVMRVPAAAPQPSPAPQQQFVSNSTFSAAYNALSRPHQRRDARTMSRLATVAEQGTGPGAAAGAAAAAAEMQEHHQQLQQQQQQQQAPGQQQQEQERHLQQLRQLQPSQQMQHSPSQLQQLQQLQQHQQQEVQHQLQQVQPQQQQQYEQQPQHPQQQQQPLRHHEPQQMLQQQADQLPAQSQQAQPATAQLPAALQPPGSDDSAGAQPVSASNWIGQRAWAEALVPNEVLRWRPRPGGRGGGHASAAFAWHHPGHGAMSAQQRLSTSRWTTNPQGTPAHLSAPAVEQVGTRARQAAEAGRYANKPHHSAPDSELSAYMAEAVRLQNVTADAVGHAPMQMHPGQMHHAPGLGPLQISSHEYYGSSGGHVAEEILRADARRQRSAENTRVGHMAAAQPQSASAVPAGRQAPLPVAQHGLHALRAQQHGPVDNAGLDGDDGLRRLQAYAQDSTKRASRDMVPMPQAYAAQQAGDTQMGDAQAAGPAHSNLELLSSLLAQEHGAHDCVSPSSAMSMGNASQARSSMQMQAGSTPAARGGGMLRAHTPQGNTILPSMRVNSIPEETSAERHAEPSLSQHGESAAEGLDASMVQPTTSEGVTMAVDSAEQNVLPAAVAVNQVPASSAAQQR